MKRETWRRRGARASRPGGRGRWRNEFGLTAGTLGSTAAQTIMVSVFPLILSEYAGSAFRVGLAMASEGALALLVPYSVGLLSDRLPRRLTVIGVNVAMTSLLLVLLVIGLGAGSLFLGYLGDRLDRGKLLRLGILVTGMVLLAGVFARDLWTALPLLVVAGFGAAAVMTLPFPSTPSSCPKSRWAATPACTSRVSAPAG